MLSLPPAKINLGLNVVATRKDGYHDIETVFYPVPLRDVLEITEARDDGKEYFQMTGLNVCPDVRSNLVYRVYRNMRHMYSLPPMHIYLCKHIPSGAGLGGGSSDAAETMKLINEIFALGLSDEKMEEMIRPYGADCPFFIKQKPIFATGTGDIFSPVSISLRGRDLVLVKPEESVSTAEAYHNIIPMKPLSDIRQILREDIRQWKGQLTNDFEATVFRTHPRIAAIKQTLYDMGALYAQMSGSGSAVFGIFDGAPAGDIRKIFMDCFTFHKKIAL